MNGTMNATLGRNMEPTDMALILKTMNTDAKSNLLFLLTGMELQATIDREKATAEKPDPAE